MSIERIRKLLSMTVENGCTEDEQDTAMRIAAGLAAKAGIDLGEVGDKEDRPKIKAKTDYKEMKPHQALAAEAAAVIAGVEAAVFDFGKYGFTFTGREELIEVAEEVMFFLFRQIESLYKESLPKGMTQRARAEFRKTFKVACAKRTLERAREHVNAMSQRDDVAMSSTGKNALVVRGYFDTLRDEIAEWREETIYAPARARVAEARKKDEERLNAMSDEARARVIREREKAMKDAIKKASKRRGRPGRSLPVGNGTAAGLRAGDRVKLRDEL